MTTALNIAALFIESNDDHELTNMKLNKMLYFAQAAHLAEFGEPLFADPIEAWDHGPVVRRVYNAYKHCARGRIKQPSSDYDPTNVPVRTENFVMSIAKSLFMQNTYRMRDLSHEEGSPWHRAYEKGMNHTIPVEEMRTYYRNLNIPKNTKEVFRHIPRSDQRNSVTGRLVISADDAE